MKGRARSTVAGKSTWPFSIAWQLTQSVGVARNTRAMAASAGLLIAVRVPYQFVAKFSSTSSTVAILFDASARAAE